MAGNTTYADLIRAQNHGCNVAVDVQAFERVVSWTKTVGREITWQATVTQNTDIHSFRTVDLVRVVNPLDDPPVAVFLTSRASVALVDANPSSFYFDAAASIVYVSCADKLTPNARFVVIGFYLYFDVGSAKKGGVLVNPSGDTYYPYVVTVPNPTKRLNDPLYGVIITGGGTVSLNAASGNLDELFRKYIWEQGRIVIRLGGDDLPFSEYPILFTGSVQDKVWTEKIFNLVVKDANEDLMVRVPKLKFAFSEATETYRFYKGGLATGSQTTKKPSNIEETAATRIPSGQAKPVAYGVFEGIQPNPICLTTEEGVYILTGHANKSITSVKVGSETVGTSGEGTTFRWYATADNNIIYVDSKTVDLDLTLEPAKVDFKGKMDEDGNLINNFADIVEDLIVNEAGLPTELDQTVLARTRFLCNLFNPRVYIPNEAKLRDILENIMRSTLGYFYLTNAGQYRYDVWCPSLIGELDIEETSGDFLDLGAGTESTKVFASVTCEYAFNPSRGNFQGGFYLAETVTRGEAIGLVDKTAIHTMQATYHADSGSAFVAATRMARLCSQAPVIVPFRSTLKPMTSDLLDRFKITKERLPNSPGTSIHARVLSLLRNLGDFTMEVTVDDQRVIGSQAFIAASEIAWGSATVEQKDTMGFWTDPDGYITTDPVSWGRSRYY